MHLLQEGNTWKGFYMAEPILTKPITIRDIEEMEARGMIREIVHGQWVNDEDHCMAGELHGAIATNLIIALGSYVKTHQLGRVYPADTTYILEEDENGVQVMGLPDVSFVAAHRVKTQDRETFYQLAPDLAIEIISPSERAVDIRTKLKDYLRAGVHQVWQVYPNTHEVAPKRAKCQSGFPKSSELISYMFYIGAHTTCIRSESLPKKAQAGDRFSRTISFLLSCSPGLENRLCDVRAK
jgi:Uma2 family endonuclease